MRMLRFCFSVAPKISHPQFCEIQAGWAFFLFLKIKEKDVCEAISLGLLKRYEFDVQELQSVDEIPEELLSGFDEQIQENLWKFGYHFEVHAYETGGGDMRAPVPDFLKKK